MTAPGPMQRAALEYARRDLAVFPVHMVHEDRCSCGVATCPTPAKHPVGRLAAHGFTSATTDIDTICRWWEAMPGANIGLLLEQLVVVDLDSEAAQQEAALLGLPPGPVAMAARGPHHYFRLPAGLSGRRTTRRGRSRAIDVLAAGYVIAPPSLHHSGTRYRWVIGLDQTPLMQAPAWAVEWLSDGPDGTRGAVALPPVFPPVNTNRLAIPRHLRAVVRHGLAAAPTRYASRSEALFAVLQALIRAAYDDITIAAVVFDPINAISAKPREQGLRWLADEIARARAKCRALVI